MRDAQTLFAGLMQQFREGTFRAESNHLHDVAPLQPDDLNHLPPGASSAYRELVLTGQRAVAAGEVGAVILAGGMATRFAYDRPKGLYPILDGKSFLQLKIEWLLAAAPHLPIFVMTSFRTDDAVRAHLAEHHSFGAGEEQIQCFVQDQFPRLTPNGELFQTDDVNEQYAAPGHGDFPTALQRSGLLDSFLHAGGKYLSFSNVDNLGASLDLAITGWHITSGCEMTIEVAHKVQGDKGGAPARVGNRIQLVEGFAFPQEFDQDAIPVFNTATYVFTAAALKRPVDLPWYVVAKTVGDTPVIQFEHLAGDLSRSLSVTLLAVDRDDRFIPVKSQNDVPAAQQLIRRKADRVAVKQTM